MFIVLFHEMHVHTMQVHVHGCECECICAFDVLLRRVSVRHSMRCTDASWLHGRLLVCTTELPKADLLHCSQDLYASHKSKLHFGPRFPEQRGTSVGTVT